MLNVSLIRLTETESTNNYAIDLLSHNPQQEGTVIITDHQSKGRGQDTNSWESERGKNLTFSIILHPKFTADQQFVFNKAISLGIFDFLQTELPQNDISIKWPNDIYIGDKKACGILIQNSVTGKLLNNAVVGIGLNVNQTHFVSDAPNPVSMKMLTGCDYNLDELLLKLLDSIFKRYAQVKPETYKKIETDYHKALYRLYEWHKFALHKNVIYARITGTNSYGQLLLETEMEQIEECDIKEVQFIP
jgi:BirA family biotin operon repressor/biotin-[acetyl-CoA-carboxylase] ligase